VLTLDGTEGYPGGDERLRVLLLENIHPDAVARLGKDGYHARPPRAPTTRTS
jgi:hypothetical protein